MAARNDAGPLQPSLDCYTIVAIVAVLLRFEMFPSERFFCFFPLPPHTGFRSFCWICSVYPPTQV